ncbi:MAG: molybdopterin dinucleotide binding domain-containing protein [Nitrososphaerota archaeon]
MIKVILITGRSFDQGTSKSIGKFSKEYMEKLAICELDPEDLKSLGIESGQNVKIKTKYGEVIVKAIESKQAPHKGIAFMPYGLWANLLLGSSTNGSGMPTFKGIEAIIDIAKEEKILNLNELLKEEFEVIE